jgi:hypothetical protein
MLWEMTQALIAVAVVIATIAYNFVLLQRPPAPTPSEMLPNAFFLVIGFYFGRTNHARIGDNRLDTR